MRKWELVFTECQLRVRHTRVLCRHCLVALEGEAHCPGEEKGSVQCTWSVSRLDLKGKWP